MNGGADHAPGDDRPDEELHVLFEHAREPLDPEPFLEQLEQQLRAARRGARLRSATTVLLGASLSAVIVLLASPYVAQLCIYLGTYVPGLIPRFGDALVSPAGWAVSIVLAAWLLRRGVLGR